MNKKEWYTLIVGALALPVLIDQLTKWIALLLLSESIPTSELIGFGIYKEALILSGQFNISQYVKIVSSFGFSMLFLLLFFVLNLMLVQRVIGFRVGIAVFVAGMIGESIDMIFYGASQNWVKLFNAYVNLTDLYILLGVVLTVFFCIKDRAILFRKNNLRKKMLVEKDQTIFCFYILFSYLLFIGAVFIFFLSFIKIIFNGFLEVSPDLQSQLIKVFFVLFSILCMCFLLITCAFSLYISNKIYGPVYAFKKYMRDVFILGLPVRPFKLRAGDHFNDIPELVEQLQSKYIYKEKKE